MSADPLAVHAPGEADLNLYAYVKGAVLKNVDPLGLTDGQGGRSGNNGTDTQGNTPEVSSVPSNQSVPVPVASSVDENGQAAVEYMDGRRESGIDPHAAIERSDAAREATAAASGTVLLYQSDGTDISNGIVRAQEVAGKPPSVGGGYSHASLVLDRGEAFSADGRGSVVECLSSIYGRAFDGERSRDIDVYKSVGGGEFDVSGARSYAEQRLVALKMGSSSLMVAPVFSVGPNSYGVGSLTGRGEISVCSTETAAAAAAGGLRLGTGQIVTAPNDLSRDPGLAL